MEAEIKAAHQSIDLQQHGSSFVESEVSVYALH